MDAAESERLAGFRERWARLFPQRQNMRFDNNVVQNPYCPQCRFCCGPQEEATPFPMALLDSQVSPRTPEDFYLLDRHTACLDQRGCKALGPCGCRLDNTLRPIACNLFPYVLVNGRLYLYRVCPASMFMDKDDLLALGKAVHAYLASLPERDRARISIERAKEDLAEKYLDLHLSPLCADRARAAV